MAPRGPTAYFLFLNEHRTEVAKELKQAGEKPGVAAVGKALGERWRSLSDEERQRYKELAVQRAEEIKAQGAEPQPAAGSPGDEADGAAAAREPGDEPPPSEPIFALPAAVVKRIATMDPDVSRISADGLRLLGKAAELFVQQLAGGAREAAAGAKRRTIRLGDVTALARRDRRLQDMGLRELLETDAVFAEVRERSTAENQGRKSNKANTEEEQPKGVRPITAFFPGA